MSTAKFNLLKLRLKEKRHSTLSIQANGHVSDAENGLTRASSLDRAPSSPAAAPVVGHASLLQRRSSLFASRSPPRAAEAAGGAPDHLSRATSLPAAQGPPVLRRQRSSLNDGDAAMPSASRATSLDAVTTPRRMRPSVSGLVPAAESSMRPGTLSRMRSSSSIHSHGANLSSPPRTPLQRPSSRSLAMASPPSAHGSLRRDASFTHMHASPPMPSVRRVLSESIAASAAAVAADGATNSSSSPVSSLFLPAANISPLTPPTVNQASVSPLTSIRTLAHSPSLANVTSDVPVPPLSPRPPLSPLSPRTPRSPLLAPALVLPSPNLLPHPAPITTPRFSPRLAVPPSPLSPLSPRRLSVLGTLDERSVGVEESPNAQPRKWSSRASGDNTSSKDQQRVRAHTHTQTRTRTRTQQSRESESKPVSMVDTWPDDLSTHQRHGGGLVDAQGITDGDETEFDEDEDGLGSGAPRRRRRRPTSSRCCPPCLSHACPDYRAPFWNTRFRFWWDIVLALVSLYHFVSIPLRIGEYEHWTHPTRLPWWAIVDYPFDTLFIIDILLRCAIFIPLDEEFVNDDDREAAALDLSYEEEAEEEEEINGEEGSVVSQSSRRRQAAPAPRPSDDAPPSESRLSNTNPQYRIFRIYLKGNFTWDVLCSLPLDLIAISTGVKSLPFLRLNKLIRLRRFAIFFDHFPDRVEEFVRISPSVWRIVSIFCAFALVAHWSACAWCYVGQISLSCPDGLSSCVSNEPNWLEFDGKETAEFGTRYVRALYGMISTLFTIGLADIRPLSTAETVVFIIVALLGAILCSRATATIASIFQKYDAPRVAHEARIANLKAYMSGKFLPAELQLRVLYYFEHLWKTSRGMDEKKVLESLPSHLRMEALVFLEGDAIRKVPFFASASSGLINSIALVLQPMLFSPDTFIQVKGQVAHDLFLVHKGECGRIEELGAPGGRASSDGSSASYRVLNVLRSGSYFGEMSLFRDHPLNVHASSVKSFTFLELFRLSRTDFEQVMKLCCNNDDAETSREIGAMYRHQLAHLKSQSKVTKLLGHDFENAQLGADDAHETAMKRKWYYRHILPDSTFRHVWNVVGTLIVLYWFLSLPFRITFMYTPYNLILNSHGHTNTVGDHTQQTTGGTPNHTLTNWLEIEVVFDIFFLVDLLLRCRFFAFHRTFEEAAARKRRRDSLNGDTSLTESNVSASASVGMSMGGGGGASPHAGQRMVQSRPELIFQRYKRSRHLLYDCISSLPIDYLIGATLGWQWWCIPRLLRLFRLHMLRSAHSSLQGWLQTRWRMNPVTYRLLTFFTVYCCLMHWCACGWYGVGRLSLSHDSDSWLNHELDLSTDEVDTPETDDVLAVHLVLRNYVRSFYFVVIVTTTTAGYKDILAYSIGESIFASFLMMSLALLYYFMLGVISTMLTQLTLDEHLFQEKMDSLHTFLKQHVSPTGLADLKAGRPIKSSPAAYSDGISPKLAQTIRNFHTYLWYRQRGVQEEAILADLPTSLREEVAVALNADVLTSMTLFGGCTPALVKSILSKFHYQIYLPNEYLCRANDVASEMFILNRGLAVVVSPNETITFEVLNRNTAYGEALFLMQMRRKASVKTIKFCDVSMLTTSDFQSTIAAFPLERQRIFENSVVVRKRQVKSDRSMEVNRKLAKVRQVMAQQFTVTVSKYRTWSPGSAFVRNWQLSQLVLIFYQCIMIPLRIAFVDVTPVWVFYIEYAADALFWADIYLNWARFSFFKHNGHLAKDPQLIAARYRQHGMWTDIASSLPLDIVALCVSRGHGNWLELMAYLRLPRVLRLIRIPFLFKRLRQFVQDAEVGIEVNYVRLAELGIACLLIAHWIGCCFFWIARLQGGVGEDPETLTWLHLYGIENASFTTQYLASLYWALSTITVVCYGDVIPLSVWEHVYVIFVAVVCFFLVAALIGNIASLITHLDHAAAVLSTKLNRFDEYARRHGLSELLQYRVHQYWIHLHKLQQGVDETALLADMPRSLRVAVATARYLKYIRPQPYFAFCEPNLLHQLADALRLEVFIPGDLILAENDLGRKFYIAKRGQVQIVKAGVGGANSAHTARRFTFGGLTPAQVDRHSPFLTSRRTAANSHRERREPVLGLHSLGSNLHGKNSPVSASTPDLHGPVGRSAASRKSHQRHASMSSAQHAAAHGRLLKPPGHGGRGVPHSPSPFHARSSSRQFTSGFKSALVSRQGSSGAASSIGGASQIEMSVFSLNAHSQNASRRLMDPRASHSGKQSLQIPPGAGHRRSGRLSPNSPISHHDLVAHNHSRLLATAASGHETIEIDHIVYDHPSQRSDSPEHLPVVGTPDAGAGRASISKSRPSYSLRDIITTAMLHHPSYAQDGLLSAPSNDGHTALSSLAHTPQRGPVRHAPIPSPLSQPFPSAVRTPTPGVEASHNSSTSGGMPPPSLGHFDAPPMSVSEDPIILHLDEGSMLGELSFFLPLRRTASIYAATFCTFLVLDRKQFNEIMVSLPHYVEKMRDIARASVESQAMNNATIKRNFTRHTSKLRRMCLVAADRQEKLKWGPEFQTRTAARRSVHGHVAWLPGSTFVQLWKLLIVSLIMYSLYVVPFRVCFFDAFPHMSWWWLLCDYGIDAVFVVDLYFNMQRFGFIDEALGIACTNAQDIARNYRRTGHFKLDLITLLPIDLLAFIWPMGRHRFFALLMFRLSKVLRAARLFDLVRALGPLENKILRAFGRVGIGITEGGVRFTKMFQIFVLVAHWIACLWFIVGYRSTLNMASGYAASFAHASSSSSSHTTSDISWLQQDDMLDVDLLESDGEVVLTASGTRIYVRSLYFAVKSLCTLGMADITTTGENTSEMVFAILVIMVSAVVLAAFVATFETTFHHLDADVAIFHRQMEYNRAYMKAKQLPQGLQDRINLYYSYIWNRSKGVDETHALADLSSQLRMDVMMFLNADIISKVSVFHDCELGFIKSIAGVLQAAVFMPDDIIIRGGTISAQMYFIDDGVVLMERDGLIVVELGAGDFFGQDHLLSSSPSEANYIAQTFCDVFTLSRAHYEQIIEYFPKYRQVLIWKMNAMHDQKRRDAMKAKEMTGDVVDLEAPTTWSINTAISTVPQPPRRVSSSPLVAPHLPQVFAATSDLAMDIPSPLGPGSEKFHQTRRGSFQQHRHQLDRKRQEAEQKEALEAGTFTPIASPSNVHATAAPPSLESPTGTEEAAPPIVRVHAGRLNAHAYLPQVRSSIGVDVLVPSFRLSGNAYRALPSPFTYKSSMSRLGEFNDTTEAPTSSHRAPPPVAIGSIISTPMPHSSPSSPDTIKSMADELTPLNVRPLTVDATSEEEPRTFTFHLRQPRDLPRVAQPASQELPSWPPRDDDIDDAIREELSHMRYVGLTAAQRAALTRDTEEVDQAEQTCASPTKAPRVIDASSSLEGVTATEVSPSSAAFGTGHLLPASPTSADVPSSPLPLTTHHHPKSDSMVIDVSSIDLTDDADEEPLQLTIHASPRRRGPQASEAAVYNLHTRPRTGMTRSSSMPDMAAALAIAEADPTGLLRSALGLDRPAPLVVDAIASGAAPSQQPSLPPDTPSPRRDRLRVAFRPRSKSHDFGHVGAESDLHRLLATTARRVARHLRKPLRAPTLAAVDTLTPTPVVDLLGSHARANRDHRLRRHSFNAGIFNDSQAETGGPAEQTFKSVFDF